MGRFKFWWALAGVLFLLMGCAGEFQAREIIQSHNSSDGGLSSPPPGPIGPPTPPAIPPAPPAGPPEPSCLKGLFASNAGTLKKLDIPIAFNGRITFGDLDNDNYPDFVVAQRNRIAAYTVCGQKLWEVNVATNWDWSPHYFWNYTTFGVVGDADGDGKGEFLHIGGDWRTVYVRDGKSGQIKQQHQMPAIQEWMYVALARRSGETERATRVVVLGPASGSKYGSLVDAVSFDIRGGSFKQEWSYRRAMKDGGRFIYPPPQVANLDGRGGDEIFHGTHAISESGQNIWLVNADGIAVGGIHALTVRDLDPARAGLEAVFSAYGPHGGQPSLLGYGYSTGRNEMWRAYSPHSERHPHQHTTGDFFPNLPGLEVLARNANGFNHWFTDTKGKIARANWRVNPGWNGDGEYVHSIEWDSKTGTEVLYLERHVTQVNNNAVRSRFVVVSPINDQRLTDAFGGGVMENPSGWTGYNSRGGFFNPYEAAAIAVDLIGDGREEVLTWGGGKITIFYNSGNENVPRRWTDIGYRSFKSINGPLYSPR
ncbi:MAG: hypothetical protein KDD43_03520 [Bdellovibrionales bacterium]|nr:hypothetical protein [Bdellovibrionales bacterium]